jgi:hypothetical protein
MPRLVVHPGSSSQWEIQLKPGTNSIGRSITNHFQISDPSVSGSHCQILVSESSVRILDLGSTNGTFVNRQPVQQKDLVNGCFVQLGDVQLQFLSDQIAPETAGAPISPALPQQERPQTAPLVIPGAPAGKLRPSQHCKFHPAMAARFECPNCKHYFCDACVATRGASGQQKFCRHCGSECVPVTVQYHEVREQTFSERLAGAFAYPLRGAGVIILVVGIVLLGLVKCGQALFRFGTMRTLIFGVILEIFAGGYLFTYLQAIVHSTAAEDRELPDLPGIGNFLEDVILPFFKLLLLTLFCFAPAAAAGVWMLKTHEPTALYLFIGATAFGYLFYPMAFLAVAILDSLAAANPLLVVPSVLKVPGKYLLALLLLGFASGIQWLGGMLTTRFFPEGWTTHEMGALVGMLGTMVFTSFLSFYVLIVGLHVLGLIFVTSKSELGWLK